MLLDKFKRNSARLSDRDAVGDSWLGFDLLRLTGTKRWNVARRILSLNTDYLNSLATSLCAQLGCNGNAGSKTATTDRNDYGLHIFDLVKDFHADGSLADDDIDVIERRNEDCALLLGIGLCRRKGLAKHRTLENHVGTVVFRRVIFRQ